MIFLLIVTVIWAFSFGLTKGNLAGVDPLFISFARLIIALIIFLPFLRLRKIGLKTALKLMLIGALQFGVMYITLNYSYRFLKSYEVALLTITTPLFVTLINDWIGRRFHWLFLVTALASVIGAGVVVFSDLTSTGLLTGFILLQISNLCFAFGQVYYCRVMQETDGLKDVQVFGLLYLGAVIVTGLASAIFTPWSKLQLGFTQIWTLVYLGAIASGVSFFLWNLGARKVDAGALAIFNDLKVPLAVAVSLLVFGEKADAIRLVIGGVIVVIALIVNEWLLRKRKYDQAT
jgi:drug/metabolite transporter (DMT)-like permease